jgi:hypothetical protein
MLFFEPQRGLIGNSLGDSNFYQYRVRCSHRPILEAAIKRARVGDSGLEYEPRFYGELEKLERETDAVVERLLNIAPDCVRNIPRRQDGLLFAGDDGSYD